MKRRLTPVLICILLLAATIVAPSSPAAASGWGNSCTNLQFAGPWDAVHQFPRIAIAYWTGGKADWTTVANFQNVAWAGLLVTNPSLQDTLSRSYSTGWVPSSQYPHVDDYLRYLNPYIKIVPYHRGPQQLWVNPPYPVNVIKDRIEWSSDPLKTNWIWTKYPDGLTTAGIFLPGQPETYDGYDKWVNLTEFETTENPVYGKPMDWLGTYYNEVVINFQREPGSVPFWDGLFLDDEATNIFQRFNAGGDRFRDDNGDGIADVVFPITDITFPSGDGHADFGLRGHTDLNKNGYIDWFFDPDVNSDVAGDAALNNAYDWINVHMREGMTAILDDFAPQVVGYGGAVMGNNSWEPEYLYVNGSGGYLDVAGQPWPYVTWSSLAQHMNGAYDEGPLYYPGYNYHLYPSEQLGRNVPNPEYRWDFHMRAYRDWMATAESNMGSAFYLWNAVDMSNIHSGANTYYGSRINNSAQGWRFGFTGALLTDSYYFVNAKDNWPNNWLEWMAVDQTGTGVKYTDSYARKLVNTGYLGCPTGEAYTYGDDPTGAHKTTMTEAMGVRGRYLDSWGIWCRDFDRGKVCHNPTGSSQSISDLAGLYKTINSGFPYGNGGNVGSGITVGAYDGIVLLKVSEFSGSPSTATPTATQLGTYTPTNTYTPTPTLGTQTPTRTPTWTRTPTPTITPGGPTLTFTPTEVPTQPTPTGTNTPIPTDTPTPTPTLSPTPTPTATPDGSGVVYLEADADASIDAGRPNTQLGADNLLYTGWESRFETGSEYSGASKSTFLYWDIETLESALPAQYHVRSATLRLYNIMGGWSSQSTQITLTLRALNRPFNELLTTWNLATSGDSWQLSGALGAADVEDTIIDQIVVRPYASVGQFVLFDVTDLVNEWLAGTRENYGVKIQADACSDSTVTGQCAGWLTSASRENISYWTLFRTFQYRPQVILDVTSALGTPTPTPTYTASPTSPVTATPTPTQVVGTLYSYIDEPLEYNLNFNNAKPGFQRANEVNTTVTIPVYTTGMTCDSSTTASTNYTCAFQIPLWIPQGATIITTTLDFWTVAASDNPNHTIWAEDADQPAKLVASASNITARATTTASLNWVDTDVCGASDCYASPADAAALIQEYVDRVNFKPGDWLTIIVQGKGDANSQWRISSWASPDRTNTMQATISWQGGKRVVYAPAASLDDGYQYCSGGGSGIFNLTFQSATSCNSFRRWVMVRGTAADSTPEASDTVSYARSGYTAESATVDEPTGDICVEDADDPAIGTYTGTDISDRTCHTTLVSWRDTDVSSVGFEQLLMPDITAPVQEWIDDVNFDGADHFNLIFIPDDTGGLSDENINMTSYDNEEYARNMVTTYIFMALDVATPTPTPTPTFTNTPTAATPTFTPYPTAVPGIYINEWGMNPVNLDVNGDGRVDSGDMFVEFYNSNSTDYSLAGSNLCWKQDALARCWLIETGFIPAGEYLVLFESRMNIDFPRVQATPVYIPTPTPSSWTSTPTPTPTRTPTNTLTPTPTFTGVLTNTPTPTTAPTFTPTYTPTGGTPTNTPTYTDTPTATATADSAQSDFSGGPSYELSKVYDPYDQDGTSCDYQNNYLLDSSLDYAMKFTPDDGDWVVEAVEVYLTCGLNGSFPCDATLPMTMTVVSGASVLTGTIESSAGYGPAGLTEEGDWPNNTTITLTLASPVTVTYGTEMWLHFTSSEATSYGYGLLTTEAGSCIPPYHEWYLGDYEITYPSTVASNPDYRIPMGIYGHYTAQYNYLAGVGDFPAAGTATPTPTPTPTPVPGNVCLLLLSRSGSILDQVCYGGQQPDHYWARLEDGHSTIVENEWPTQGNNNNYWRFNATVTPTATATATPTP